MTDALAAFGVMSLVASGQFPGAAGIVITLFLAVAVTMKESWRHEAAQRHFDTTAVVILVAAQVARTLFTQASILDLLIEFAVVLQIIRVSTRKGAAHDQQVIVLALLHLIAGTVVGGGLGYGLCFFGLSVVTPGALVLSHLRREVEGNYRQGARDRTGLPVDVPRILRSKRVVGRQFILATCFLSVPILVFTILLFLLFPRVGLSILLLNRSKGERMIGFSGKVDLGQIGTLRTDHTIALRVMYPNLGPNPPRRKVMHLRGTALDRYDGKSWTQSTKTSRLVASGGELFSLGTTLQPEHDEMMRIELEPIEPPVLFLPPNAHGLRLQRGGGIGRGAAIRIHRGAEDEFRYQAPNDRGVRYTLFQSKKRGPSFLRLPDAERYRYLQLPNTITDKTRKLALSWTQGIKGDYRRALALQRHLRTDYRYDLSSPSGTQDNPLEHFLFSSKRGHCEYYSTAMAVMLRVLQIPSRNVTGFAGGTYNSYGQFYAVRQGDAHSWVEAFVNGHSWMTFDPTPPGASVPRSEIAGIFANVRDFFEAVSQRWNRHVLGYDLRQQVSLFESFRKRNANHFRLFRKPKSRVLVALLGLAVMLLSTYWLYRRHRRRRDSDGDVGPRHGKDVFTATNLYQNLDAVMSALGIGRCSSTPPMHHALRLSAVGHPHASEIVQLTGRYLEARFGQQPMALKERHDFEQRLQKLKQQAKHHANKTSACVPDRKHDKRATSKPSVPEPPTSTKPDEK